MIDNVPFTSDDLDPNGEVAVSVNERTGTSSGTSSTSVSILDRLRAPAASEMAWHYVA